MFNRIRNIKKHWFVVTAAVALLSVGLVSGAVFAANGPAGLGNGFHFADDDGYRAGKGHGAQVLARVAEIIGVEQDTLENAFKTAFDEQAGTRFDDRVDALVADETLTEDEGNAAKTWFADRPELSGPLAIRLAGASDSEKVDSWLAKLVESEKLTQAEADALSEWHDDRPESLPELGRKRSGKRHGHRDGHADGDDDKHSG